MKSELWYLLDELESWEENVPITSSILKEMINNSFERASKDQEEFEAQRSDFNKD